MKSKKLTILTLASIAVTANAASISINVTDGGPGFGAASATNLAGVVEAGNWNTVSFTSSGTNAHSGTNASNLLDDSGASSSVAISNTGTWGLAFANSSGFNTATALFNDSMITNYSDTNTGAVTLTGISYATYDVYIYSSRPFTQEAGFTIGAESRYLAFDANAVNGPLEEGSFATQALAEASRGTGNYVKFSGISGGTLTIQAENVGNFFSFNGIQVVDTTVVPEPSSTALLGLGGLALILRRRK